MNSFTVYIAIAGMVLIMVSLANSISQVRQDLLRMNNVLDKIAEQVGVPGINTEDTDAELVELILHDKKIEAIKRYRIKTGMGLKESKDYIDELALRVKN